MQGWRMKSSNSIFDIWGWQIGKLGTRNKVCTFKRGVSPAFIFCLNFSRNSEKLITTCDNGTLQVFDIKEEIENLEKNKEPKGFIKVMGRGVASALSVFVPKEYEDSFGIQGAVINYYNENLKITNLVGFCDDEIKEIFCFTSDGTFSMINIDHITKKIEKSYEISTVYIGGSADI